MIFKKIAITFMFSFVIILSTNADVSILEEKSFEIKEDFLIDSDNDKEIYTGFYRKVEIPSNNVELLTLFKLTNNTNSLTNTYYFSVRRNKVVQLFEEAYRIDQDGNKISDDEIHQSICELKKSIVLKDATFNNITFDATYKLTNNSISIYLLNSSYVKYFSINAVEPLGMSFYVNVTKSNNKYIITSYAMTVKPLTILATKKMMQNSVRNRLIAIEDYIVDFIKKPAEAGL